jgi:DNA repair exonuclease SbcCD nuclease subunit
MEHGSVIAYLCYEKKVKSDEDTKYFRVGSLLYYRSHKDHVSPTVQVRIDFIPDEALQFEFEFFIGNFIPSEKVPEPPFIDGDLFATTEERGMPVICGHIHTRQNASSKKLGNYEDEPTQYYFKLRGLPVYQWKKILGGKPMCLTARTE